MYTIYVNDCPLTLVGAGERTAHPFTLRYPGAPKFFLTVTGTLEGGNQPQGIQVVCADPEAAWRDFRSHYDIVEAAGGAVFATERDEPKLLCIYRRGAWDLPKGKIDVGESPEDAALREVSEETGLTRLRLGSPLPTTYHTYYTPKKGRRVLKPTYWYRMTAPADSPLVPQTEEDIERAEWVSLAELDGITAGMYRSLRPVVTAARAASDAPSR